MWMTQVIFIINPIQGRTRKQKPMPLPMLIRNSSHHFSLILRMLNMRHHVRPNQPGFIQFLAEIALGTQK